MFPKLPSSFLLCAALAWADPVKVVAVAGGGQLLQEAKAPFEKKYGAGLIDLSTQATPEAMAAAKVIFLAHPDPEFCRRISADYEKARRRGAVILITQYQVVPQAWNYKPDVARLKQVETLYSYGGVENTVSLLAALYLAGGGVKKLTVPPAQSMAQSGIWHPQATREFKNLKEYLEWYRPRLKPDAPLVGITFYNTYMRQRDLAHIEALVQALEKHGMGAVPAFGWPFHTQDPMLAIDGKSPLRVILALNLGIMRPDDTKWLTDHGVLAFNIQTSRESPKEWAEGMRGLPIDRIAHQVNTPERTGAALPLLIGGTEKRADGTEITVPIPERVDMCVRRVKRWITLQDKPNAQKRVAFVYYNNPPGKGNLGASYLQVLPSMATMLRRLKDEGYDVGSRPPDGPQLLKILERSGRNIEKWAPGELEAMVEAGGMTLWPIEKYKQYFATLPAEFRNWINKEYGPPEKCELLRIETKDGRHFFIIPGVKTGNIFLGVQPLRGTFERITAITHDTRVPVPHAYVAAYLWWRYEFKADAITHVGRHGTLEWLPGKQVMQSSWDHGDALQGDLPNPYYYITDGGGEALQALRRSAAVMMSHLTPILLSSGITPEYMPLKRSLDKLIETEERQPELAAEYRKEVDLELAKTKIDQQLGLRGKPWPEVRIGLKRFLDEMEDGPIPAGIHELGVLPPEDVQREGLAKFIEFGLRAEEIQQVRADLRPWADSLFDGQKPAVRANLPAALKDRVLTQHAEAKVWLDNLRLSPKAEVDVFPRVLSGKHIPSAPIGEILRVPAGLPTGRNLFGFDPLLIPTKAAWELGRKMAADTISRYRAEHNGGYPERMSMMLWYDETESHHGAMESMAMHLMGVEPTWNTRAQVDGLKLIPDSQMTHPRVNILFNVSGIYRDGFGDKMLLLDRAVRLAASAGDNPISRQDKLVKAELMKAGVDEKKAETIAKSRVFGNQPGAYAIGVDRLVEQSQNAGNSRVADLYLHNMNYAYSNESWGETAPKALENHFKGNQVALFSRTSNLYGALDNDDMYSYAGAMSFASQTVNGGQAPTFYLHNLRKRGGENMVNLKTFLATELNQRAWNPKWIDHMKRSGYAGAREMYREVEHLYGFQATTADSMDGQFWQNTFDVYVADKHGLELKQFFEKENPHARQNQLARLLEVDRQGAYKFNEADRSKLVADYVRSINQFGAACSANICGNKKVQEYVASVAPLVSGLGSAELRQFGKTLAQATRWNAKEFANAPKEFREGVQEAAKPRQEVTERRPTPPPPATPPPPPIVTGRVMKEKIIKLSQEAARAALPFAWSQILALFAIVMLGYFWEGRRTTGVS